MTTDRQHRARLGYRVAVSVAFVVMLLAGVLNVTRPGPLSTGLMVVTVTGLVLAWGLGPVLRGARPRWLWWMAVGNSTFFLMALAARPDELTAARLGWADLFYSLGYLGFAAWAVLLVRRLNALAPLQLMIDTATMATAAVLAFSMFGHHHPHPDVGIFRASQPLIFPILDAVLLAISAHVGARIWRTVPVWWCQTLGIGVQLLLDIVNAAFGVALDPTERAVFDSLCLVPFFLIAVWAAHPSTPMTAHLRLPDREVRRFGLHSTAAALLVPPGFATLLLPAHDDLDRPIRFVLVGILLGLLLTQLVVTLRDLRTAERRSRHRATHDPLTGLVNRSALVERLQETLDGEKDGSRVVAVFFLDCDHFKRVNDTWGHHAGDALLQGLADVLTASVRAGDVVARHGGDEFVLVTVLPEADAVHTVARRVQERLESPILIAPGRRHRVTSSIGVAAVHPHDDVDPLTLIARADAALYEAKKLGRGRYAIWHAELGRRLSAEAALGDALREAVTRDLLTIDLQPIMGGPGHTRVAAWEALARWTHADLGPVPPDRFIPLAEDLGLMDELGRSVLRQACSALARLRAEGCGDAAIFVNISPSQPTAPGFVEMVLEAVEDAGLSPGDLWLELTENILATDADLVRRLSTLRQAGVHVGLDDFGTLYASVAALLQLPVDFVKLDRSLMGSKVGPVDHPEVFAHLLGMLTGLGLEEIVAEGVETAEQAQVLAEHGCPMIQGWHPGRPAPLETWLDRLRTATPTGRAIASDGSLQN